MNSWMDYFYIFISGAALLISGLGVWFTVIMPGIDHWNKSFFRGYFLITMMCCISSIIEVTVYYFPAMVKAIYLIWMLESVLLSLPALMLMVYLLHSSGEDMHSSRLFRAVTGLWAVFLILIACAPLIGGYAYITKDMQYIRRPIYPVLIMPIAVIMLLDLIGVIHRRRQLSRKVFSALLVAVVPLTVAIIVQLFIDTFWLLDISFVFSAIVMYSLAMSDQIEKELSYQKKIADQRAGLMVLQMRPHFIYNTMTSIYCLCNQDIKRARQVIMDFTTYLRRNFTAIASMDPVPFSAELMHTQAYLAVEQAQYEGSLFVDYDTPHTMFRVPPLTLQPIVENAVKHGRDLYAGPLRISVRTRKTASGSEIIVADNGRGYAPSDDNEPHIALENIKERLEFMCGGSLTIKSGDSGGTEVTITIPDGSAE